MLSEITGFFFNAFILSLPPYLSILFLYCRKKRLAKFEEEG